MVQRSKLLKQKTSSLAQGLKTLQDKMINPLGIELKTRTKSKLMAQLESKSIKVKTLVVVIYGTT